MLNTDAQTVRVARLIERWDALGVHRTATPVDNATAEWLVTEAADAGLEATLERFTLERVDVSAAYVEVTVGATRGYRPTMQPLPEPTE